MTQAKQIFVGRLLLTLSYAIAATGLAPWINMFALRIPGVDPAFMQSLSLAELDGLWPIILMPLAWLTTFAGLIVLDRRKALWALPGLPAAFGGPLLLALFSYACIYRGECM
ncbi:MAG: hypothetical protein Q8J89_08680 [Caulobacter sp.]|nr:hypothetical protein [Caulobacter sp.]